MASHLTEKENNSTVDQKRFAFVELMLIWEGRINAAYISQQFELGIKLAAHVIQKYKTLYPENMAYEAVSDSYVSTSNMVAQFTGGSLQEYVQLIAAGESVTQLAMPTRNVKPLVVRPILQAIREQRRLSIAYASVSHPEFTARVIQPHNIVFDGLRWHVRAYCEKNNGYRDFVLSRFDASYPSELLDGADHYDIEDELWQTLLDLEIIPDPRLDENRTKIIALDYDMTAVGQNPNVTYVKTLQVRAALLMYLINRLGLDQYHNKPEAQQIILSPECQQSLKPYLPD
jgi:hypothetical protein